MRPLNSKTITGWAVLGVKIMGTAQAMPMAKLNPILVIKFVIELTGTLAVFLPLKTMALMNHAQ